MLADIYRRFPGLELNVQSMITVKLLSPLEHKSKDETLSLKFILPNMDCQINDTQNITC